ncbi:enoyl-CoA hydratase/isomerase family protein [Effusibacillus lacus]|uniref:Enoyl-CoA hydratase n=1 Tax=Effusibacillus lacus TaxID=1348429 RepID=A0A292YN13_9BACL|nr:enoyl-CoA hydratase-related protein [Effusibacillus lacus]TCS71638.1 enoyl-CoA hydratase [Effusibacillus lacus]GAX90143.1 enoyl-CoA hydratase [Effusibacillus lacus]
MEFQNILANVEQGLGIITINRPAVRNALNMETVSEMRTVLQAWKTDPEVQVVVFTGSGEKSFAAGADISQLRERTLFDALESQMQSFYRELELYEKPTIAAINGFALGGGCELALACDIRIASTHAKMGLPELNLGIIPGAGGTQRLARLVGRGKAVEMILTGSFVDAEEARTIGLVTQVAPPDQLMAAVRKTADAILGKGPLAVRLAKLAIQTGLETDLHTGLVIEKLAQAILFTSEDKREGTTAFLEKRKPNFQGK